MEGIIDKKNLHPHYTKVKNKNQNKLTQME